jgi:hypothetical protein
MLVLVVPEELVVGDGAILLLPLILLLLLLLMVAGPFDIDGQKLPVCCRQLNWATTSGSTGVPSGLLTTSRKASFAMDPPRGSFRDGHMIQGKPWDPSTLRRCSVANPFPSNTSNSLGVRMMGVPSKSVPFLAAKAAKIFCPAGVKAAGV